MLAGELVRVGGDGGRAEVPLGAVHVLRVGEVEPDDGIRVLLVPLPGA